VGVARRTHKPHPGASDDIDLIQPTRYNVQLQKNHHQSPGRCPISRLRRNKKARTVVAAQSFCTFPIRKLGLTARGRIVKIVKIMRKALNKRVYIIYLIVGSIS